MYKLPDKYREPMRAALLVLLVFAVSRSVVLVASHLNLEQPIDPLYVAHPMFNWDSGWYKGIAADGYEYAADGEQHNIAFFPLYPLLVRAVVPFMPGEDERPYWLAQTLIAHLAALAAMFCVYSFVRRLGGASAALWALCLAAFFPPSLFLSVGYPEGLFLALGAGAGVAMLAGRVTLAAALVGLASACRPTSLAFVPTLLYVAWKHHRDSPDRFWKLAGLGLLSVSGGLLYAGFLAYRFGSPLVYARNFEAWFLGPDSYSPFEVLYFAPWMHRVEDVIHMLRDGPLELDWLMEPPRLVLLWIPATLLISINGLAFDRTELRKFYWIPLLMLLIPYWSSRGTVPTFDALGRYLTAAYPMYAALGMWVARGKNQALAGVGLAVMAVLLAYAAYCFGIHVGPKPFVG